MALKYLHRVSHGIKRYLSHHISGHNLRIISFIISLLACLSLGSIMLFSLYSPALNQMMKFTYLQINFVASLSAIGMYLSLPVLGYLGDMYGPPILSIISIWFFCPSYLISSIVISSNTSHEFHSVYLYLLGMCFCSVGLATSSLFFSSLLTCAKIYPDKKGLAISLPIGCYGLSTLIGGQILRMDIFQDQKNRVLNLFKVFKFFTILYLVIGVLNFVANSIVSMESEVIFIDENSPLVEGEDEGEETPLIPQRSHRSLEPVNHKQRYKKFLRDKSAWLLLISLIINIGPLEAYQNNLSSIISKSNESSNLSNQVSLMALSSTVIRLGFGGLSDYLSNPTRKYPISKVWLLCMIIIMGSVGQFMLTQSYDQNSYFSFNLISFLNGGSYGGLFTIYPTIVASIWGIDIMGSTWGSFMVAPAIGSIIFSLLFGRLMDINCKASEGATCLKPYFITTGVALSVSLVIVLFVWRVIWWKRGFRLF